MRLYHVNEANFQLSCELCNKTFKVLASYTAHKSRIHACTDQTDALLHNLRCPYCNYTCFKASKLLMHFHEHISLGTNIECPFLGCSKHFNVSSSFRSHISRCHKGATYKSHIVDVKMPSNQNKTFNINDIESETIGGSINTDTSVSSSDELAKYLGHMLLKFQAKYNIPSSTVQSMTRDIEGLVNIYEEKWLEILFTTLAEKGNLTGIDKDILQLLMNESSNAIKLFLTQRKRYSYFEKRFSLVKPHTITLGRNRFNKLCSFQYIPIGATLMQLLKHEDVITQVLNPRSNNKDIIIDFSDGQFHKSSALLSSNSAHAALQILMFYDEFQVTNPIGTHQTNHKICGFYYVLGNLYKNNRSCLKAIQLCMLCRSIDMKYFGLRKILEPLITDLKQLYQSGIDVPGVAVFKGRLSTFSCDNLGSHQLGGFMQSFSPNVLRICRTCLITSSQVQENIKVVDFVLRTPDNYERHAKAVAIDNSLSSVYGIKFMSPLNEIPEFHVARGLPPDVMHDLLEGVVPFELSLILRKLISDNLFTLEYFNRRIANLKYKSSDSRNKPEMQKLDKNTIVGTASQNWTLLRLLAVLIGFKIPEDNVIWNFFLQLKLITEISLSPIFTIGHIDLLQSEIWHHLEDFKHLFPESRLKPKHHFLMHYPQHIINFGPLVSYWCMRFEAKHKILKDIARQANQFRNVPYTLSFRHQLAQCFYHQSSQGFFNAEFQAPITEILNIDALDDIFQNLIRQKIPSINVSSAPKVSIGSTEYKIDDYLIIGFLLGEPIFGRIEMILLFEKNVWFLVQKCDADYISHYGSFTVSINGSYDCVEQISLIYWDALPSYEIYTRNGVLKRLITLKHMVFDSDDFE